MERKPVMRRAADERGFTAVEAVVLAVILGILAAITVPSYFSFEARRNDTAAKSRLRAITAPIGDYYEDHRTFAGMTLAGLRSSYDSHLDVAKYGLGVLDAGSYCVQTTSGGRTWHASGPATEIARGACRS